MIATAGSTFTGIALAIIIFGSLAAVLIWPHIEWRTDIRRRLGKKFADDMAEWAEPSRRNRTHEYQRADTLSERPALPDDYREWGSKT